MVPQSAIASDASITINNYDFNLNLGDSTYQLSNLYNIQPKNLILEKPAIIRIGISDSFTSEIDSIPFIAQVDENEDLLSIGGSKGHN